MPKWRKNGWKTARGKDPVCESELKLLDELLTDSDIHVHFCKVGRGYYLARRAINLSRRGADKPLKTSRDIDEVTENFNQQLSIGG